MDQETSFLENYEAQNTEFQEANSLNVITHDIITFYNQTACRILLLGSETS